MRCLSLSLALSLAKRERREHPEEQRLNKMQISHPLHSISLGAPCFVSLGRAASGEWVTIATGAMAMYAVLQYVSGCDDAN